MLAAQFHPYSTSHVFAVLGAIAATWLAIAGGLRARDTPRERSYRASMAGLTLLLWLISSALWLRPGSYDAATSLPLHVCDLTGLLVPLALLARTPWVMGLVYFWGLALSANAFLTPTLNEPFPTLLFFNFWATHAAIVGGAVYLVIVERYRPTLAHLAIALAALAAYTLAIMPLNLANDWNYGYVGPKDPSQPTVISRLGAWPGRLVWLTLLVTVAMALCWLPWAIAKWWGRGRAVDEAVEGPHEPSPEHLES